MAVMFTGAFLGGFTAGQDLNDAIENQVGNFFLSLVRAP